MALNIHCSSLLDSCLKAIKYDYPFVVAARYGELLASSCVEATKKQYILLPIADIETYISQHLSDIQVAWRSDFNDVKRIVKYGGKLAYEEMMQVLTIRSELEFAKDFAPTDLMEILPALDQDLRLVIAINPVPHAECVHNIRSIVARSDHWWCASPV